MLILVGKRTLKKGAVLFVTDGHFTGLTRVDEESHGDIPTAILCMFLTPDLPRVTMFKKSEWIRIIDIDCKQILTYVAHCTNIIYEGKKVEVARSFAKDMPYFEKEVIYLDKTPWESVYQRFSLGACLSEGY